MKSVGIAQLKAHLSAHLKAVRKGSSVVILDRNEPVARLVPMEERKGDLVIRPRRLRVTDLPPPRPMGHGGDIVETLSEERADRF
jgi:prevent-host-death family protein